MRISINLNDEIKDKFKDVCDKQGLTLDMMMNIFAKITLENNGLPFDIRLPENYVRDKLKKKRAETYAPEIEAALAYHPGEDPEKVREKIIDDICDIETATTFIPYEYFRMKLHTMDKEQWLQDYLCDIDSYTMEERMNQDAHTRYDMCDKYNVYKRLKKYYKRDAERIVKKSEMYKLYDMLDKYGRVIVKPLYGSLGKDIVVLDAKDVVRSDTFENNFLKKYDRGVILEEVVDQNEVMATLSPNSINTLRMLMLRDVNEEYHIYSTLRVGTNDSITDNICNGGLTCMIDADTGRIIDAQNSAAQSFERNPGNNNPLIGMVIPDYAGAVAFAKEISDQLPEYRYIGWDIALSKKGWCIIEFNGKSGIACLETAIGRGLRKEFEDILKGLGQPTDFLRIGRS